MAMDGHTFGVFTQSQKGVRFTNVVADIVDTNSENRPENPSSPNHPRKDRWTNYTNPILGDSGNGRIGRWQEVKIDAVATLVDQMIELYLKDKTWYSTIRCREALWNMYRKLAWYVKYQVGDDVPKYQQALRLIKDCIYKIEHPEKIEKRKIFEELFKASKSNKFNFSSGFLQDTTRNAMKVEGKQGEHTVRLDNVFLNYDGSISFQYGGRVQGADLIELHDNGKKIWEGLANDETKTQELAIVPGLHNFVWVYKSNGGTPNPMFWLSTVRVYEDKPIYSKFNVGLVDVMSPPDLVHDGFSFEDMELSSGWLVEDKKISATILNGESQTIKKNVRIDSNESYFQFEYSSTDSLEFSQGTINVYIDGTPVWGKVSETHGTEFIRIDNLPAGDHDIEIEFRTDGLGNAYFTFQDFEIVEIVDTKETDRKYNQMGIPFCPAPFPHRYNGAFFADFDGQEKEIELFNTENMPKFNEFPGYFRYVSSSEEQEWDLAHSVGGDEMLGDENILKMDVSKLKHGNHTKITSIWKFKERGNVTFDYLASVDKGNGLIFFINDRQVSEEWSQQDEWGQASFNVQPGQTYKFDWLVRSKSTKKWGLDAVYVKNIKYSEVIPAWHSFFPKPIGEEEHGDWYVVEESSVMEGGQKGERVDPTVSHQGTLCGECDGEMQFSYTLDVEEPGLPDFHDPFFSDDFSSGDNYATGNWGKDDWSGGSYDWNQANSNHSGFNYPGGRASTIDDVSTSYDMHVFNDYLLDRNRLEVQGTVSIECPPRYIHHYDPVVTTPNMDWETTGNMWKTSGRSISASGSFKKGSSKASTYIWLENSGSITFNVSLNLGSNDKLIVYLNGSQAWQKTGSVNEQVKLDLAPGNSEISFEVIASGDTSTPTTLTTRNINSTSSSSISASQEDVCYPAGSEVNKIDYGILSKAITTKRQETFKWNDNFEGMLKGATPVYHYTTKDQMKINRKVYTGPVTDVVFAEKLKVYKGKSPCKPNATASLMSVNLQHFAMSMSSMSKFTHNLTTFSGTKTTKSKKFYSAGQVKVSFSYSSVLKWGFPIALPKGKSVVTLVNADTGKVAATIFSTSSNSGISHVNKTLSVSPGNYYVKFSTSDYVGTDKTGSTPGQISYSSISFGGSAGATKPPTPPAKPKPPGGTVPPKKPPSTGGGGGGGGTPTTPTNPGGGGGTPTTPTNPGGGGSTPKPPVYQDPCAGVNTANGDSKGKDPTVYPGHIIVRCMKGSYVKAIQQQLKISADGIFGTATVEAIKKFQKKNGLGVDGIVGPLTWQKLFGKPKPPEPPVDYKVYPDEPVCRGDDSKWVVEVQKRLIARGYKISSGATGDFAQQTAAALNDFLDDFCLPHSTCVTKSIWTKLFSNDQPTLHLDKTKVRVTVKDAYTGALISDKFVEPTGAEETFDISVNVPRGKNYEIIYTLYKGNGTKEGLLNGGGGMLVSDGTFTSKWDAYCIGADGKPYPDGENPPDDGGDDSDEPVPDGISVSVNGFTITEMVPHWTGGCDMYNNNNYMYVTLLDGDGNPIDSRTYNGNGVYDFVFTDLEPLPNPNYSVVIETLQGGGYDQMHPDLSVYNPYSFHIDKFEVWEKFQAIPDPFNSVLDFYIDGVLMGTYDPLGMNEYIDLSFPVKKGCHNYKWAVRQIDDRFIWPWDRAKVDWVELTNWICDEIMVTPYCDPGNGDKCVEALIHCLIPMVTPEPVPDPEDPNPDPDPDPDPEVPKPPLACKIGKKIWLFT